MVTHAPTSPESSAYVINSLNASLCAYTRGHVLRSHHCMVHAYNNMTPINSTLHSWMPIHTPCSSLDYSRQLMRPHTSLHIATSSARVITCNPCVPAHLATSCPRASASSPPFHVRPTRRCGPAHRATCSPGIHDLPSYKTVRPHVLSTRMYNISCRRRGVPPREVR